MEPGVTLDYIVTDKNVTITADKHLRGNESFPVYVREKHRRVNRPAAGRAVLPAPLASALMQKRRCFHERFVLCQRGGPVCRVGRSGRRCGQPAHGAIRNRKVACRVVMPLYGDMKQEYREKLTYITNFTVPVGWRNQYCGLFELTHNGVKYYFLDNEYYFKRTGSVRLLR